MTAEEAKRILEINQIDPLIYSIGRPGSTQCEVLEKSDGVWSTYFWERGIQHFKATYPSEEAAVAHFVNSVVESASLNEHRKIVLQY